MAYLTKKQVQEIIQNAPQGTNPVGIISALRKQGHQLEEYEEDRPEEVKDRKTFIEKVGGFLGLEPLGKGLAQVAFTYTPTGREMEKKIKEGAATQEELQAY